MLQVRGPRVIFGEGQRAGAGFVVLDGTRAVGCWTLLEVDHYGVTRSGSILAILVSATQFRNSTSPLFQLSELKVRMLFMIEIWRSFSEFDAIELDDC